jgi:aryl-alcohol dehydrogenase-like predicted oxidoreductase
MWKPPLLWPSLQVLAFRSESLGRADAQVSALGFGGHHSGEVSDEKTAVEIVHQAVDSVNHIF